MSPPAGVLLLQQHRELAGAVGTTIECISLVQW
jgi:hypothetical protein